MPNRTARCDRDADRSPSDAHCIAQTASTKPVPDEPRSVSGSNGVAVPSGDFPKPATTSVRGFSVWPDNPEKSDRSGICAYRPLLRFQVRANCRKGEAVSRSTHKLARLDNIASKGELGSVLVRLMMVINDMTLAMDAQRRWTEEAKKERAHRERGAKIARWLQHHHAAHKTREPLHSTLLGKNQRLNVLIY